MMNTCPMYILSMISLILETRDMMPNFSSEAKVRMQPRCLVDRSLLPAALDRVQPQTPFACSKSNHYSCHQTLQIERCENFPCYARTRTKSKTSLKCFNIRHLVKINISSLVRAVYLHELFKNSSRFEGIAIHRPNI